MEKTRGYAPVNGLKMYYELEGVGDPLLYIPPHLGVAGVNAVPALTRTRSVITVDLQGHGRTADLPERPMSIQQNARDVIALLQHLGITKADLLGESYGGATAILVALYSPELVGRVATYGATFGPPAEAHNLEMLRFDQPRLRAPGAFSFSARTTRGSRPSRSIGQSFGSRAAAFAGTAFRLKSWRR